MKNPFSDFQPASAPRHRHRVESFHLENEALTQSWMEDYKAILTDELDNLYWQASPEHLASVYNRILAGIGGSDYSRHDIESFLARLDQADPVPLRLPGPTGLFLSALVNCCREAVITVFTHGLQHPVHFVGYRLPQGKALTVNGNTGDFAGAGLCGGALTVNGSTGNWCGAGMTSGSIRIRGDAGMHAGQWMHGGTLHVDGAVGSIGKDRFGGRLYHHDGCDQPA